MTVVSSLFVLLSITLISYPNICESLKCYECSGQKSCGHGHTNHIVDCVGKCATYSSDINNGTIGRRCCVNDCNDINSPYVYLCTSDRCNGIRSDLKFFAIKNNKNQKNHKYVHLKTTIEDKKPLLQCFRCSSKNPNCALDKTTLVSNCEACVVSLNPTDNKTVVRQCCKSNCATGGTIKTYYGRQTYFCASNQCNGIGSENLLKINAALVNSMIVNDPLTKVITTTATTTTTESTTKKTIFQCYECSGPSCGKDGSPMSTNCPSCMVYRNPNDPSIVERRCCWWACGASNTIGTYNGMETYFCAADKCNGYGAESALSAPLTTTTLQTTSSTTISTTPAKTIFQCYECSGPSCGKEGSPMSTNCPSCMLHRNRNDPTIIERTCCWWQCGPSNSVSTYNGMETYFCAADKCNGYGAESALSPSAVTTTTPITTTSALVTTSSTTISTTPAKTIFQCYECSGPTCGKDGSPMSTNCPSCMVYRNPNDSSIVERRCCWWQCGPSNSVSTYNGMETYFCAADKCNGYGAESALSPSGITTTTTKMTPTASASIVTSTMTTTMTTMTTTTTKTIFQCYDCSGPTCGKDSSMIISNCPKCMVYRNPKDPTTIERRCCWWGCGPSNSISTYNELETYFCAADKCNGYGAESALSPAGVTTTTTTTQKPQTAVTTTTTTSVSITTPRMTTTTTTMSTTPAKTSFQCYDCSGPQCGSEGSSFIANCPTCMVYRNPNDQTIIERRCCWWACGASNTLGTYNGMETYFCAADKCNGYGTEFTLSPPVTTTTKITPSTATTSISITTGISTTTTRATTTTAYSPSVCMLNCRNGGTPETEDGCFCYCLENTYGRECENVDCAKPDVDPETCSIENQPLCQESEEYALECHHLCGKC